MAFESALIILTALATAVSIGARWLKMPYTVALVVAGILLSQSGWLDPPHLTKDLLYPVFLPGLLFEAAFHLDFRCFWQNKWVIGLLAVPGVILGTALTAGLLSPVLGWVAADWHLGLIPALAFGALISATDPIAVVALFKTLGAPTRLTVLVEAESLLNDGTAVVLFTLVLGMATGQAMTVSGAVVAFLAVAGLGACIGLAVGYCVSRAIQIQEDPMVEITLTTLAAYGSFLLAEHLHLSGVMATVAAGMVCGSYGARTGMSPSTRLAVESFWNYVAYALNSVIFLLIGFEIHVNRLLAAWLPISATFIVVLVSRSLVVFGAASLVGRTSERLQWQWRAALVWGGLRGGLSMVLALALPASFPQRALIITLTFGVVALTILLQGLTIAPLLMRLGLMNAGEAELNP
jgi:CPA1 family monovalent cation:H+ antiporter